MKNLVITGYWGEELIAYDRETGKVMWRWKPYPRWKGTMGCDPSVGDRAHPVLKDGVLYFASTWGEVVALDPQSGRVHWKYRFKGIRKRGCTPNCVVVVAGGLVLAAMADDWSRAMGWIVALDRSAGKQRWRTKIKAMPWDFAVVGSRVFVSSERSVFSLQLSDGKPIWTVAPIWRLDSRLRDCAGYEGRDWLDRASTEGLEIPCGDRTFVVSQATGQLKRVKDQSGTIADGLHVEYLKGNRLVVTDLSSGKVRWKREGVWLADPGLPTFAIADGVIYLGEHLAIHAVDLRTGRQLWRFRLSSPVKSQLAVADGVLYFSTNDAHLYALR